MSLDKIQGHKITYRDSDSIFKDLNQPITLKDLVEKEDHATFPTMAPEILNYLSNFTVNFKENNEAELKEILSIKTISFTSYLNSRIELIAYDIHGRLGHFLFISTYFPKEVEHKENFHHVTICWNYDI